MTPRPSPRLRHGLLVLIGSSVSRSMLLRLAVEGAKRNRRHSGICGQAPSDYPEIAEYLIRLGIDSISLNPDVVLKTTLHVEQRLGRRPRQAGKVEQAPAKA